MILLGDLCHSASRYVIARINRINDEKNNCILTIKASTASGSEPISMRAIFLSLLKIFLRLLKKGHLLEKSEVLYIPERDKKFSYAFFLNFRWNVTEM